MLYFVMKVRKVVIIYVLFLIYLLFFAFISTPAKANYVYNILSTEGIDPTVARNLVVYTSATDSHQIDSSGRGGKIVIGEVKGSKFYTTQELTSNSSYGVGSPKLIYNPVIKQYELVFYYGKDVMLALIDPYNYHLVTYKTIFSFSIYKPTYIPNLAVDKKTGDLFVIVQDTNNNASFIKVDKNLNVVLSDKNIASGDEIRPTINCTHASIYDIDRNKVLDYQIIIVAYENRDGIYYKLSMDGGEHFIYTGLIPNDSNGHYKLSGCGRVQISPINVIERYIDGEGALLDIEWLIIFEANNYSDSYSGRRGIVVGYQEAGYYIDTKEWSVKPKVMIPVAFLLTTLFRQWNPIIKDYIKDQVT